MFLTITSKPLNNSKVIPYQALLTHQSAMMSKNSSKFHIFLLRALTTCLLKIDGQKLLLKPNEVILIKKISSLTLQSLSKKSALQILLESYSASYPFDFVTMGGSPLIHDMMHNTNPTKSVYIVFRHLPAQIIRSYYNLLANLENQNAVADPTITFEKTTLIGLLLAELIRNYQKLSHSQTHNFQIRISTMLLPKHKPGLFFNISSIIFKISLSKRRLTILDIRIITFHVSVRKFLKRIFLKK